MQVGARLESEIVKYLVPRDLGPRVTALARPSAIVNGRNDLSSERASLFNKSSAVRQYQHLVSSTRWSSAPRQTGGVSVCCTVILTLTFSRECENIWKNGLDARQSAATKEISRRGHCSDPLLSNR
jgi:hypothetical protein